MAATPGRQVAVLFANVTESTKLYESTGDQAAISTIEACLAKLRESAASSNGRVLKNVGDGIMAVFPTPDAAALAASSMQYATETLPPVNNSKLSIQIGFHYGPVIQTGTDIFGDTVNLAARLAERAGADGIITSRETADQLGAIFRNSRRPPYSIHVRGRSQEVEVCELIWRQAAEVTMSVQAHTRPDMPVLQLKYRGQEVFCRRHDDLITLGRETDCHLVVDSKKASRHHCNIERRQDKFVLADQSANGTYVTPEGGHEMLLQREEFMLTSHGWISFGEPRAKAEQVVEYFCS